MGTYGIINGQKEEQGGIYDMTYAEIEFVVFCIEELAAECGMSGNAMYHLLADKTDMIVNYIVPNYEVLHSMGRNTIVEELKYILCERGVL
jgi:hypothetical protein